MIPAFNEEATLPGLIQAAKAYVPDIMVIDDGSNDATTLVSVMAGAMTHRFATNLGKGEALKAAFEYAVSQNYDWVFTMDGDGEHDPTDLSKFFSLLERFDLILGTRSTRGRTVIRRSGNSVANLLVSAVSRQRIYDSQTGFRAYRVQLLRNVPLEGRRYELETEVIIKASRRGFRIGQVDIRAVATDRASHFNLLPDSLLFFRTLAKSMFSQ